MWYELLNTDKVVGAVIGASGMISGHVICCDVMLTLWLQIMVVTGQVHVHVFCHHSPII